jgi:serine/threonine-protein kinase
VNKDSNASLLANRYLIRSTLGKGGFGQTFLAEDTHSPARYLRVVKQLKPQNTEPELYPLIRERFEREAVTLERLGEASDQIPTLRAYFSEADEFYLVQDWVDGQSISQKVREGGPLSEAEAREFLCDILPVLDFVHSQGVIHRDIKPDNVMLRARDGKPILIDFGAVKEIVSTVIDSHGYSTNTIAIGTKGYTPIEQFAGKPVFASDIFSLGLTAIFALTGRQPLQMHDQRAGGVAWREHAPGVSRELAEVLDRAVEENARDRFPSARQMLEALTLRRPPPGPGGAPVNITEPALLIRINKQYKEGISAKALYDSTRGVWRIGRNRERARYAMAVYGGVVREVYTIEAWHPAEEAFPDDENMHVEGRWAFTGRVAPDSVRDKYVGRSVAHYFKQGNANPVFYVNC